VQTLNLALNPDASRRRWRAATWRRLASFVRRRLVRS
jgi:hypothetical protein